MLAIVFSVEKFHQFIYGKQVQIETDHKPLETIFKKKINSIPPRLQRFSLRLQRYDLVVRYVPGKLMYIADALSRTPIEGIGDEELAEEANLRIHSLIANLPMSNKLKENFQKETSVDPVLTKVMHFVKTKWPEKSANIPKELQMFATFKEELHVMDNLLFKNNRLVVPSSLTKQMLERIHESHIGITKSKARARECLYWSGMSQDIEKYILSCTLCRQHQRSQTKQPMVCVELPTRPWQIVAADIFEVQQKPYLLLVDYFSKYPEIVQLKGLTSLHVIQVCQSIFSRFGIPSSLITDNGPQFSSLEFRKFSEQWEFLHKTSSPGYQQANGLAERTIQTVKKLFLKSSNIHLSMLELRNTPIEILGLSPAQLLMGRRLRDKIPTSEALLLPEAINCNEVHSKLQTAQMKSKQYYDKQAKFLPSLEDGDEIYIKNKENWIPGTVQGKVPDVPRSYIVSTDQGTYRRNRRHLQRSRVMNSPTNKPNANERENTMLPTTENADRIENNSNLNAADQTKDFQKKTPEMVQTTSDSVMTRGGRRVIKPKRLLDYI